MPPDTLDAATGGTWVHCWDERASLHGQRKSPLLAKDAKSGPSCNLKRELHAALLKHHGLFVTTEVDLGKRVIGRVSHDLVLSYLAIIRLQGRRDRRHSLPVQQKSHLYVGSGSLPSHLVVAGFQLRAPDLYGIKNIYRMLILIPCEARLGIESRKGLV